MLSSINREPITKSASEELRFCRYRLDVLSRARHASRSLIESLEKRIRELEERE